VSELWMTAFCATEKGKSLDLTTPFTLDGWRYATDGYVCIRVPTSKRRPSAPEKTPDVLKLPWGALASPALRPWKATDAYRDFDECSSCEGEEYVACHACHGKREAWQVVRYRIDGRIVQRRFFGRVAGLPGVQLATHAILTDHVGFTFADGGQGLVVPMLEDKLENVGERCDPQAA
jgi:hypothetical protein